MGFLYMGVVLDAVWLLFVVEKGLGSGEMGMGSGEMGW